MTISYVGAASASSTSVSLPTFQTGDIALVIATGSSPSLPSGWTDIATTGVLARSGFRVLQAGDTTTGTWTGATRVCVAVYRGFHAAAPFDGVPTQVSATSTNCQFNAATLVGYSPRYVGLVLQSSGAGDVRSISTTSLSTNRTSGETNTYFGICDGTANPVGETYAMGETATYVALTVPLRESSTFPIIADQDTTSGTVTSNSSSWTLTYPTNIAAGDLLLAFVANDGGSSYAATWPADWIAFSSAVSSANTLCYAKKKATGSESGNFTVDLTGSEQGSWVVYRIPAGTWEGTHGVSFSDGATGAVWTSGASQNPDPPSLNPANWDAENTLWFAVASVDTSRTVSAYPSSPDTFTNTGSLVSGGAGGATLAWGRLEKNASSVDPGTFTISNSDDWAAATIAIRPAAQPKSLPPSRPLRHPLIYR